MKEIFGKNIKREQKKKTGKQPADFADDYTDYDEKDGYQDKYPFQEDTGFLNDVAKKLRNLDAYGSELDDGFYEEEEYYEEDELSYDDESLEDDYEYSEEDDYETEECEVGEEVEYADEEDDYYEDNIEDYLEEDETYDEQLEEDELEEELLYTDTDVEYFEDEEYMQEDEAYEDDEDENLFYADDDAYTESEEYYGDEDFYEDDEYEDDYVDSDDIYESEEDGLTYVSFDGEYEEDDYYDRDYAEEDGKFRDDVSIPVLAFSKIVHFFKHMKPIDSILVGTAIIVFAIAIITIGSMAISRNMNKQIEALAPIGEELSGMGVIGESNLLALADNRKTASTIIDEGEEITSEVSEVEENNVSVNFISVERDLKIKFTYTSTEELVKGTTFEVELTDTKGKTTTLKDDDQDGVIYESNMSAGTYDAVVKSVGDFVFPNTAQKITVKDKIEYVVINVQDEIKAESEINVAAEDTAQLNAAAEADTTPTVVDTVEWVESTKTAIDDSSEYKKISKDDITDPSTLSKLASIMKLAGLDVSLNKTSETLYIGGTVSLEGSKFSDSSDDTEKITYSYKWSSSDDAVATVSDGTVTAKGIGSATITYTVTKKTVKIETTTTETSKDITVEEYESLSSDEQKKCTEIKKTDKEIVVNEDGTEEEKEVDKVTGYTYKTSEPSSETKETEETGTATCSITVKDVTVTSGELILNQTSASVNAGATITVSPSKLTYTYTNGKTDSKTSDFPGMNWTSSDTAIATVNSSGVITGVKAGSATITASVTGVKNADGKEVSITASCKVTVNAVASLSLALDQSKASVVIGKTVTIKPTVQNAASDSGVTWSTSDKSIATVDKNGVVTGVKLGSVTITATTNEKSATTNAKLTATCTVTVISSAMTDTKTLLKDNKGNQVYIQEADGDYEKATYADYYTADKFFIKTEVQYKYTGWQTIDNNTYYFDKNGNYVTGTQVIQGIEYNFTSEGILKMDNGNGTLGIDVSKWNGSINWTAVKNAGVDFAIIRCGYRGSSTGALIEDPYFKTNIQNAKAAGIKVGIYFFTQAVNEREAVEEASMAIALAKNYSLTYPIFIDTESSGGRADGLDKGTRTAVVNAFCKTIANAGYKSGIYASKSWYENKLNTSSLSAYKIWLAQYASKPTYGGRYDMWQYTSKGSVGGISGKVDMNRSYLGY